MRRTVISASLAIMTVMSLSLPVVALAQEQENTKSMGSMGSSSDKDMITTAVAVAAVAGLAGGITSSLRQHGQLPQIPGQVPPPYYENCENVWDALGHPITLFEPGYREGLDHDKDGIACERDPRKKK
jgi:excalibur domain protein